MSWLKEIPVRAISVDNLPLNKHGFATALAWRQGAEMPPIDVIQNADGSYHIKDGRHRILAAKLNGAERIWCKVLYRVDTEGNYYAGENFTQPVERYSNINVTKKQLIEHSSKRDTKSIHAKAKRVSDYIVKGYHFDEYC